MAPEGVECGGMAELGIVLILGVARRFRSISELSRSSGLGTCLLGWISLCLAPSSRLPEAMK